MSRARNSRTGDACSPRGPGSGGAGCGAAPASVVGALLRALLHRFRAWGRIVVVACLVRFGVLYTGRGIGVPSGRRSHGELCPVDNLFSTPPGPLPPLYYPPPTLPPVWREL